MPTEARPAGRAACVHEHNGDLLPGGGTSDERLDERRPKCRGDDGQVTRVCGGAGLVGEDGLHGLRLVLLPA